MIEKEKVKIGLQCIIDGTVRCESCGYAIDKHGHHSCQQNCASDALALLKEQEAVEARKKTNGIPQPWASWWYVCGDCGQEIDYHDRFCRWCGRAAKWE